MNEDDTEYSMIAVIPYWPMRRVKFSRESLNTKKGKATL